MRESGASRRVLLQQGQPQAHDTAAKHYYAGCGRAAVVLIDELMEEIYEHRTDL